MDVDRKNPQKEAPLGTQLGILAAGTHWLSAIVLLLGILTNSSHNPHSEEWETKYPNWQDRMEAMYDFNHTDSRDMNLDRMVRMYDLQEWLVLEGMLEAIACLAAICTLMCVKSQLNFRTPADEQELVMYACLIIGLLIPMLEVCMRAGPFSFIGWVAHEIEKGDGFFKNVSATHIQLMGICLQAVESLFTWLNTFADLLLGLGFMQLSFLGSKRADIIFDSRTKLVGFWTGGLLWRHSSSV